MAVQAALRLFTVTDYTRMRETGILSEDDRVELIAGEIRIMTPIGPLHAAVVKRLNALLSRQLAEEAIISVQDPIQLDDYTEPQPDIAVLRPRADFYASEHPAAADVLLVVEVADTSIEYDRDEKLTRYAGANIPEAWLVDVSRQTVEQYTSPRNNRYLNLTLVEYEDVLTAHAIAGLTFPVRHIFG
ncbi:MAG: Uma2 family endonuclease [Chloroflexi bacterium]|nr:Uma2 family endonuclease [Chloroflexota bacterium]